MNSPLETFGTPRRTEIQEKTSHRALVKVHENPDNPQAISVMSKETAGAVDARDSVYIRLSLSSLSPPTFPTATIPGRTGEVFSLPCHLKYSTQAKFGFQKKKNLGYKFHLKLKYNVSRLRSIFSPARLESPVFH